MIMKRNWTVESAREHVLAVEAKKKPRGLMYCSALSYLGVAPDTLTEQVRAQQEAEEARQKLLRAAVMEAKPKKKS